MLWTIEQPMSVHENIVLLGDLNYNYTMDESISNNPVVYIEHLFQLRQIVTSPTRVTYKTSSIIDIILTSLYDRHTYTGVDKITLSDHYLVFTFIDHLDVKRDATNHNVIKYRDYKRFDPDQFIQDIVLSGDFNASKYADIDVHDAWKVWKNKFMQLCDKYAPLRQTRLKNRRNPWVTREIVQLMYERDYIHKKAVQLGDSDLMNTYRIKRNYRRAAEGGCIVTKCTREGKG